MVQFCSPLDFVFELARLTGSFYAQCSSVAGCMPPLVPTHVHAANTPQHEECHLVPHTPHTDCVALAHSLVHSEEWSQNSEMSKNSNIQLSQNNAKMQYI